MATINTEFNPIPPIIPEKKGLSGWAIFGIVMLILIFIAQSI
jgi:hypothetical protein